MAKCKEIGIPGKTEEELRRLVNDGELRAIPGVDVTGRPILRFHPSDIDQYVVKRTRR